MDWRNFVLPFARLYWRVFRPRTYGVKVLILHPSGNGDVLLVRHSYGNRNLWNLPGGGYNPKRENPIEAASREVQEELRVSLLEPRELCLYQTETEGKKDTVTVVVASISEENFTIGGEIADYRWEKQATVLADGEVARVARYAIRHL